MPYQHHANTTLTLNNSLKIIVVVLVVVVVVVMVVMVTLGHMSSFGDHTEQRHLQCECKHHTNTTPTLR
jgi:flagellar basal body-associated protein FliL